MRRQQIFILPRTLAINLTGLAAILILLGCAGGSRIEGVQPLSPEKETYVTIWLEGDVVKYGNVLIRRELSEKSITDAGGGIGYFSNMHVKPKQISLERVVGGETNVWHIRFDEMPTRKWRDFLINEGDHIIVKRLYF